MILSSRPRFYIFTIFTLNAVAIHIAVGQSSHHNSDSSVVLEVQPNDDVESNYELSDGVTTNLHTLKELDRYLKGASAGPDHTILVDDMTDNEIFFNEAMNELESYFKEKDVGSTGSIDIVDEHDNYHHRSLSEEDIAKDKILRAAVSATIDNTDIVLGSDIFNSLSRVRQQRLINAKKRIVMLSAAASGDNTIVEAKQQGPLLAILTAFTQFWIDALSSLGGVGGIYINTLKALQTYLKTIDSIFAPFYKFPTPATPPTKRLI